MNRPGAPSRPDVVEAVFPEHAELAVRYVDLLATTGVEWGLIGPRETERLWERHVFNSAAVADLVVRAPASSTWAAGPGCPASRWRSRRPDLHVTLLEPLLRRATFLTQAVEPLGLGDRVEVVRARAEDHRSTYDVVVSRALAPLPRLLGWCLPLTDRDGSVLALKGRSAQDEIEEINRDLVHQRLSAEVLSVHAYDGADATTVVRVRRV